MRKNQLLYRIQLVACVLGVLVSLYLVIQHTRLKSGIQGEASFCAFGRYANCDVVSSSIYSEIFGIPIAALGAMLYFLMLLLGVLSTPDDINFKSMQRGVSWLALLALAIDLVLLVLQIGVLRTVCVVCVFTYLLTIAVLYTNIKLTVAKLTEWKVFLGERWEFELSSTVWTVSSLCLLCFAVATLFLPSFIQMLPQKKFAGARIEQFYSEWKDKPMRVIEAKDGDGTMGNPGSRVRIVEFSDFECAHCQKAAFTLHNALKPYKDQVYFIFKHYPLDSSCNSAVIYQLHPKACKLAQLSYCAAKKGKFWKYHDALFFDRTTEEIAELDALYESFVKTEIFTKEEIARCFQNEKALQSVLEDIRVGNSFSVKGTPTILINGKQLTIPLTVESLRRLIELEMG